MWANAHTARQKHTEIDRFQVEKATKKTSQRALTIRISLITIEFSSESEAIGQVTLRNWLNVPLSEHWVTIRFQLALVNYRQRAALIADRIERQNR